MNTPAPQTLDALVLTDPWCTAIPEVFGVGRMRAALATDIRLFKAALLYADRTKVELLSLAAKAASDGGWPWPSDEHLRQDLIQASLAHRLPRKLHERWPISDQPSACAALSQLRRAYESGDLALRDSRADGLTIPIASPERFVINPLGRQRQAMWEGRVATALIGEFEAFPDASIDVILDVRARLTTPRIHFRAALATVAGELASANLSAEASARAIADLRRRVVDPAMEEIRVELDSLKVRHTLLRLASNRTTVMSTAATLAVAAGAGGVEALRVAASAATVGPLASAAAQETQLRQRTRAELALRPYWYLHEAAKTLRSSLP